MKSELDQRLSPIRIFPRNRNRCGAAAGSWVMVENRMLSVSVTVRPDGMADDHPDFEFLQIETRHSIPPPAHSALPKRPSAARP